MKLRTWTLGVGYPADQYPSMDTAVKAQAVSGHLMSAGAGDGVRDMQFVFPNKATAVMAMQCIRRLLGIGISEEGQTLTESGKYADLYCEWSILGWLERHELPQQRN